MDNQVLPPNILRLIADVQERAEAIDINQEHNINEAIRKLEMKLAELKAAIQKGA